jgi:CRP-like cAMP-binding protein
MSESLDPGGQDLALHESTALTDLFGDLKKSSQRLSKRRGETLFHRGAEPIGVFLVFEGTVSLEVEGADAALASRLQGPGSILGLPGCLSGGPYSLTARVAQESVLGFVPRSDLLEKLSENPTLCLQVMHILSDEIAHSRRVTEDILTHSSKRKPPLT